jgi:phospho-N-acetylmuramoyl-pentapeptide-transferase
LPFSNIIAVPFVSLEKIYFTLPTCFYLLFLLFLILGTANAVNLTDGLDGLAIIPVIINLFILLIFLFSINLDLLNSILLQDLRVLKYQSGSEYAVVCAAMIGSGIGFLWYNTYPSMIFMGDIGSLTLGGFLALLVIFTKNELISGLLNGLFLIEAISVIVQVLYYKIFHKRVFKMAPIHHHFEIAGSPEPRIVVRFCIVSLFLSIFSLLSLFV